MDAVQAAAVPETFFTVWHNVFERGGLKAGDWFMVHGGTSGIGTTAIQLATAFGAKVITTAGSAEKCQACLDLGAARAVNYRSEDFVAAAKEATGGKGVNVTLDMVGGPYTEKNIVAAAEDGRIVQIASLQGAEVSFNIARLMMKRVVLTGSTLRARPRDVKGGIARDVTGGKGVDVTLDMIGGEYTERNIIAAADDGRIVQIASLGGAEVKINVARLMVKRVTLTGSTLRPRTREVKTGFARAIEAKVWPLVAAGTVKVVLDGTYPLANAADAHRRMETSAHIGKIILMV